MAGMKTMCSVITTVLILSLAPLLTADEARAVAALQGSGEAFPLSGEKLLIHASYVGILYLDGAEGILDGAIVHCPVVHTLDLSLKKGEASGHCAFTVGEGNVAYSDWQCVGDGKKCEGEFKFTGGSGKLTGISGSSRFFVRAALTETASNLQKGGTIRDAIGIAIWPSLQYQIAGK